MVVVRDGDDLHCCLDPEAARLVPHIHRAGGLKLDEVPGKGGRGEEELVAGLLVEAAGGELSGEEAAKASLEGGMVWEEGCERPRLVDEGGDVVGREGWGRVGWVLGSKGVQGGGPGG
eukprot:CAMPEP_0197544754 /NCGR_PEP_ID=MMETSP1320-20131121/49_1 /TAXON_ID=91990 /ORGANISM="Bolidomonas sp., Strain RCC2347" /LENGTH=117 /DNA_ID=CAMNT_0043104185 /DNA_START=82 /DNA_END=436 /DNA_ORIENTATION=+